MIKHSKLLKSESGCKLKLVELLDDNGKVTECHYEVVTSDGAVEALSTQQAADTHFSNLVNK